MGTSLSKGAGKSTVTNRTRNRDGKTFRKLVKTLDHSDDKAVVKALKVSRTLSHAGARGAIAEFPGCLEKVVSLLGSPNLDIQGEAAGVLASLAFGDEDNRCRITAVGGSLEGLVSLLRSESPYAQQQATLALASLAWDKENKARIASVAGSLSGLVNLLRSGSPVQEGAARALANLAVDARVRKDIADIQESVPLLVSLGGEEARRALANLRKTDRWTSDELAMQERGGAVVAELDDSLAMVSSEVGEGLDDEQDAKAEDGDKDEVREAGNGSGEEESAENLNADCEDDEGTESFGGDASEEEKGLRVDLVEGPQQGLEVETPPEVLPAAGLTEFAPFTAEMYRGLREIQLASNANLDLSPQECEGLKRVLVREAEISLSEEHMADIARSAELQMYYTLMQQLLNVTFHSSRAAMGGAVLVNSGILGVATSVAKELTRAFKDVLCAVPGGALLGAVLQFLTQRGANACAMAHISVLARACVSQGDFEYVSERVARALTFFREEELLGCGGGESRFARVGRKIGFGVRATMLTPEGGANERVRWIAAQDVSTILEAIQKGQVADGSDRIQLIGKLVAVVAGKRTVVHPSSASPPAPQGGPNVLLPSPMVAVPPILLVQRQPHAGNRNGPGNPNQPTNQPDDDKVARLVEFRALERKVSALQSQIQQEGSNSFSGGPMAQLDRAPHGGAAQQQQVLYELLERLARLEEIVAGTSPTGVLPHVTTFEVDEAREKLGLPAGMGPKFQVRVWFPDDGNVACRHCQQSIQGGQHVIDVQEENERYLKGRCSRGAYHFDCLTTSAEVVKSLQQLDISRIQGSQDRERVQRSFQ